MLTSSPHDDASAPSTHEIVTRALTYLSSHRCMSLATDGPDGLWAATVFYINDGFELYFLSRSDTRHARNLVATGRAAATIGDDVGLWHRIGGIQLEGAAEVLAESRRADVLRAFDQRYPFPMTLWRASSPVPPNCAQRVYVIRPKRVFFVDHAFREERFEVPTDQLVAPSPS